MKLFLNEIKESGMDLSFSEKDAWVVEAVSKLDEVPGAAPKERPIEVKLSAHWVDQIAVLRGVVRTHLNLLCSRCAIPTELACRPQFSALFCKDAEMAGIGHLKKKEGGLSSPAGRNSGFARHAHDESENLMGDIDINYVSEDFIDLAEVVSEQLHLQIPFQPLCQEGCKGMCLQCGADWNKGRCACAQIRKESPFSALQNLKL